MRKVIIMLSLLVGVLAGAQEKISPWGVCAHLNRDAEFDYRTDEQLRLMKEAGIKAARMDVGFSMIARKDGLAQIDKVYNKLKEYDIQMLPILNGYAWEVKNVRPDLVPLHDHPEEWRKYVRTMAEHFKGKITVWSFWNEPDGGFWHPAPDPKQYLALLKITHEELKKADPNNQIMLGGLVSMGFLEDVYKLGGKPYFDLVSTHPYGWGGDRNKGFDRNLNTVQAILKRHGDADKPVWFTECGSSSARNEFIERQPEAIFKALQLAGEKTGRPFPAGHQFKVGVPVLPGTPMDHFRNNRTWLPGVEFVPVTPQQFETLKINEIPAMIGCESEGMYEEFVRPLQQYIQRGGIVLAFAQVPFYTLHYVNEHGTRAQRGASDELYDAFRMGWHAWWNKPGAPNETFNVQPTADAAKLGFIPSPGHANRYLNNDKNRKGVRYTPILQAVADGKPAGDALALYTFDDWKGAIIGCTLIKFDDFVTEQQQADLAQTFSVYSLSRGVPRFYLYVFRNTGIQRGEREDNFGMVTRDLRPKPFYRAYKQMTTALGEYPKFIKQLSSPDKFFMMVFERGEDQKKVLAFWSVDAGREYTVSGVDGTFKDGSVHFVDYNENIDYRHTPR